MATIDLGKIRFNWQGAYNNSTAYVINDVVSSGGNSYICKLASTGNAVSNGTYWDLMSSAGTNGTDLTSTLTAQGDVLYRDGSGLQRLAKPASDQFLKNTSGGAVSWADPGGGAWAFISATTPSSSSSVDLTGFNASLYGGYAIRYYMQMSVDNVDLYVRTSGDGGSSFDTANGYSYGIAGQKNTSSFIEQANPTTYIKIASGIGNNPVEWVAGQIDLYSPNIAKYTYGTFHTMHADNSNAPHQYTGGFYRESAAAVDGIQIYPASGNIVTGEVYLFGIVKS